MGTGAILRGAEGNKGGSGLLVDEVFMVLTFLVVC